MSEKAPLDKLAGFYQSLDSIPTPPLVVRRPRGSIHWSMLLAPFGAAFVAYIFMSFCAAYPSDSHAGTPVQMSIDRYALDEIRSSTPTRQAPTHALNTVSTRSLI